MAPTTGDFIFTSHAVFEMQRRGIDQRLARSILVAPEQRETTRPGREVFQSRVVIEGNTYLVRVFVDTARKPAEVITVYRTSKVGKYWRKKS